MLFIQEKKPELNTQSFSTLYVPHCSVFNYMQQDLKNSQEFDLKFFTNLKIMNETSNVIIEASFKIINARFYSQLIFA